MLTNPHKSKPKQTNPNKSKSLTFYSPHLCFSISYGIDFELVTAKRSFKSVVNQKYKILKTFSPTLSPKTEKSMSSIDSLLYRPLKSGKEYEALIPTYKGIDHNFDKNTDNSNTYDTLKYMSEWAYKYAHQMSRVAPLLKGRSIQETVNNIYKFLYAHFQYKLDGETQNLYSPSAAWHFREKGFDCKTYSILASIILQNLSIPHAFRMVQQQGIMPGEWSHVYVIVPNGNTYNVLDATTHDNKEVSFTNKYDHIMKHIGLASPYTKGLGCACSGTTIKRSGLGAPNVLANTVNNFHVFLNELEKKGVSKDVTNRMLVLVKWNIENGIDPNMGEILKKAFSQSQGLGLLPIGMTSYTMPLPRASLPINVYKLTSTSGSLFQSGVATGMSALSNVSVKGVNVGGIVKSLATGNYIGAGLEVLKAIIPIEKTFGAVFANGFDISCWNSAYSEQKAKVDLEKDLPYIVSWSGVYTNPTTESLDRFMFLTEIYIDHAKDGQAKKYAKCTRKGSAMRENGVLELRKNILEEFTSQGFQLIPNGKKNNRFESSLPGKTDTSPKTAKNGYDSYTVVPPKAPEPANDASQGQAKSSVSPVAIGGALLLAAKLLL